MLCFECIDAYPFCPVYGVSRVFQRVQNMQQSLVLCCFDTYAEHAESRKLASFPMHKAAAQQQLSLHLRCCSVPGIVMLLLQSPLQFCYCSRCKSAVERVMTDSRVAFAAACIDTSTYHRTRRYAPACARRKLPHRDTYLVLYKSAAAAPPAPILVA